MQRWLSLATLFAIPLMFPPTVHAEGLSCGIYLDVESDVRLEVIDSERARILRDETAPSSQLYRLDGLTLRMFDIDEGYLPDDYTVSADGRTVTGNDAAFRKTFVLKQTAACVKTQPAAASGSCRADLDDCIAKINDATPVALKAACDDGLGFACVRWIDSARRDETPSSLGDTPPPECREGTPTFSAEACEQAVAKALGAALAEIATSMSADHVPLPAQRLDALPALCADQSSAKVCAKVAEELWIGARYADARTALRSGCDRSGDPEACKHVASLAAVADAQLKATPAIVLPCGRYLADTGLMSELDFGDRGLVVGGFGAELRARLEAGLVRIRHDKGGDFVFARIGEDRLLGLDDWNRYALYRRDGDKTLCATPLVFEETPLVEDCPQPETETADACCARGSLHGCNIVGHQLALKNSWAEAKPYYLKVCAAGVRIGCENLVQVFARGDDQSVPEDLDQICATNPRHVACDVRETTNFDGMALSKITNEFLREIDQELDANTPEDEKQQ